MEIKEIIQKGTLKEKRALFSFTKNYKDEEIILKFNLWARYFFIGYFTSTDAPFHKQIDYYNIKTYKGDIDSITDIAFRGGAKTSRTKLFIAFCIANDREHFRRYIKVLSEDGNNSKQIVTDIYNMFVNPRVAQMYPEIFEQTNYKREETMGSFTTATGIKMLSDTVGTSGRGALQEDARPDWILFEDFETRKTLRSAKTTQMIWDNMEEARTSLAKGGSCIYNANYISEMGNVHKLVQKKSDRTPVLIIPILKDGTPTWERYTIEDIEQMRKNDDDFEGERLCQPSASKDILFDREVLDKMEIRQPIRNIAGFKIFRDYDPAHRYGSGHDVAGGVGLDSSASVFIDFSTIPAQVVGTFASNTISPESFGDEIYSESNHFGQNIVGIENNKFDQAILKLKMLDYPIEKIYKEGTNDLKVGENKATTYGWNTNSLSKSTMLLALKKAISDGLLLLNDENLINEVKSYSRNDLIEKEQDPRLTTRHFDLLMALAIAWQMKDYAEVSKKKTDDDDFDYEDKALYSDIGI
jgi:hypothetical protein